jgi:hypothetical protein
MPTSPPTVNQNRTRGTSDVVIDVTHERKERADELSPPHAARRCVFASISAVFSSSSSRRTCSSSSATRLISPALLEAAASSLRTLFCAAPCAKRCDPCPCPPSDNSSSTTSRFLPTMKSAWLRGHLAPQRISEGAHGCCEGSRWRLGAHAIRTNRHDRERTSSVATMPCVSYEMEWR